MGKASIIYVAGLALLVGYGVLQMTSSGTNSVDANTKYYGRVVAHNIAVSAANMATQVFLDNPSATAPLSGTFTGGSYHVKFDSINLKGDRRITSTSWINVFDNYARTSLVRDTVIATFQYISFSKFGYFSESETNGYMSPSSNSVSGGNMWKVTGDSMFGFTHSNAKWNLAGRPYFDSKVTAFTAPSTMLFGGVYAPVFNAGYQWGVSIPRPQVNLTNLRTKAVSGNLSPNLGFIQNTDVAFTFNNNGTVKVRIPPSGAAIKDTTLPITSITNNGVIAVENGDIRVKGTYNGQVTLVALKRAGGSAFKGNVWIDGDIVANTNPRNNPNSTDMLGLVSQRMTYLTTTGVPRNSSSVTNIQAAIYTHEGVFAAENYNTIPLSGRLSMYGALSMNGSTATGAMSGGALTNGFLKSIHHDPRYLGTAPPSFPSSSKYELISWWER